MSQESSCKRLVDMLEEAEGNQRGNLKTECGASYLQVACARTPILFSSNTGPALQPQTIENIPTPACVARLVVLEA